MRSPSGPDADGPFDRRLVRLRLERARRRTPADFLLARVADDLADRIGSIRRGFPVAADLGTPGPHVADRLARDARIGVVLRGAPLHERPNVAGRLTVVADEEAVPLREASCDLVTSALSLHHANDLPGTLIQVRRALKADGLFLACLPGGATLAELRTALAAAEAELDGGASPRVSPFVRLPDAVALLQRAGFAMPVVDVDPVTIRYDDLFALARDLRAMGATNVLRERRRTPLKRSVLLRAAAIYASEFADDDGRIRATFELVWLTGWAPRSQSADPSGRSSAR